MADKVMFDNLVKLRNVLPLKTRGVTIDDGWDQMNRRFLFLLLVISSITVTLRQYTGHVISCDGFSKFNSRFVDDYCWTQGIYTIREAYDQPLQHIPYPGLIPEDIPLCIGKLNLLSGQTIQCPDPHLLSRPTRLYHLWYQWTPFYFWLLSLAFYFPYLLYKHLGVGEVKPLMDLLHNPIETEEEMDKTVRKAATWMFYRYSTFLMRPTTIMSRVSKHKLALVLLLVKSLYLSIALITFYLTAEMFEYGDYITYGRDWLKAVMRRDNSTHVVRDRLFPKMVACEIKRWGASGIEEEQGTCVLAPNVMHQYLFLILWFSLATVVITNSISILAAISRLVFTYAAYRNLLACSFLRDEAATRRLYYGSGVSGRLILHLIANNTRPKLFERIVKTVLIHLRRTRILDVDVEQADPHVGGLGPGGPGSAGPTASPHSTSPGSPRGGPAEW